MTTEKKSPVIRLDSADNIVVARQPVPAGTYIPDEDFTVQSDIPIGHKIASRAIRQNEPILKYNTVIGYAARDVEAGTHMHNETIYFDSVSKQYEFCRDYHPVNILPPEQCRTFQGYVRLDGQVGTRNFIAVAVCSNCAATVARKIANYFTPEKLKDYPNVDAIVPLITSSGCGLEKTGTPMSYLRRILGGHIKNPNIAGAVVCALGCESNNIDAFFEEAELTPGPLLGRLVIQEVGGSRKAMEQGIAMVEAMLPIANQCQRQPVPISHLKIGMECGGSDSFSGSSANPALGKAMDLLIEQGGTAVLTEITELFGIEGAFVRRAKSPKVAQKLIDLMNWWLDYCKGRDAQINGKVTPGNNAGGLTNILEKALGGAKKGGSTPLNGVFDYGEKITEQGFVIMNAPAYDPMAAAALFAGGCNLCVFTTGRGSCFGAQHFPTLKISSNTPLFQRQEDDMDMNAGVVIDGEKTLEEMGEDIFEAIIEVASGKPTKSELFGMGNDEFVVWWLGITS